MYFIPFICNLFCEGVDELMSVESLEFDLNSIRVATDNFSDANKLGQGGFGAVYKVVKTRYMKKKNNILNSNFEIPLRWFEVSFSFMLTYLQGKLPNGQDIAVKRLARDSGEGELQFKNEVLLVAKLQHRNLVRFLGFCLEGIEKLLIYEFVPNGSLDYLIFGMI